MWRKRDFTEIVYERERFSARVPSVFAHVRCDGSLLHQMKIDDVMTYCFEQVYCKLIEKLEMRAERLGTFENIL